MAPTGTKTHTRSHILILINKWVVLLADATAVIDSETMKRDDGAVWLTKAAFQFHMSLRSLLSTHENWYDTRLSGRLLLYNHAAAGGKSIAQIKGVQGICGGQVTWNVNEEYGRPGNDWECFSGSLSLRVFMQVPVYIFWKKVIKDLYEYFILCHLLCSIIPHIWKYVPIWRNCMHFPSTSGTITN